MTATEREEFLDEHRLGRTRNGPAPSRTPSAQPSTTGGPSAKRGRRPRQRAPGLAPLLTEQDFNDAVAAGAAIVLIDSASPPKLHTHPRECHGRSSPVVSGFASDRLRFSSAPVSSSVRRTTRSVAWHSSEGLVVEFRTRATARRRLNRSAPAARRRRNSLRAAPTAPVAQPAQPGCASLPSTPASGPSVQSRTTGRYGSVLPAGTSSGYRDVGRRWDRARVERVAGRLGALRPYRNPYSRSRPMPHRPCVTPVGPTPTSCAPSRPGARWQAVVHRVRAGARPPPGVAQPQHDRAGLRGLGAGAAGGGPGRARQLLVGCSKRPRSGTGPPVRSRARV